MTKFDTMSPSAYDSVMTRVGGRILLPLILLLVASCGGSEQTSDEAATKDVNVVIGILSEPESLNPLVATSVQEYDIIDLVFVKLLHEQSDFLSFAPQLAKNWAFSDDSLSITFELRQDAFWHDGRPVTAADVRYTWQLETDTLVAWPGRRVKERITDVEVLDDHTVRYRFANRYPTQLMDANDGVILPKHLLESESREQIRRSAFGRNPVGCGPFAFKEWVPGQYIELERAATYYNTDIDVARVVFRIVPDMTTLVTQLKTGEIDCLESIPIDALEEIRADYPRIRIYSYPSRGMTFVAWNTEHPLLRERDIRRALGMAINDGEIIETLWRGMAEPGRGPIHPILWAHDPDLKTLPYDPGRAAGILEKHGWTDSNGDGVLDKDGRDFEIEMITNQGNQVRADVVTMVQAYLGKIGVKVDARVLEWGTFIGQVLDGKFDSCVLGWKVPTRADLTSYWRSTAMPRGGFNISRYANPEVDALIDRAKNELDPEVARKLWYRCQRIIYDDQPMYFVAIPYEVVGLRSDICNVRPTAIGFLDNIEEWRADGDCDE